MTEGVKRNIILKEISLKNGEKHHDDNRAYLFTFIIALMSFHVSFEAFYLYSIEKNNFTSC